MIAIARQPAPDRAWLELPWSPSVNRYWQPWINRGRGGMSVRMNPTSAARLYREAVRARLIDWATAEPMRGPLKALVHLRPPDRRKRDIDNYVKTVLDAVMHAGVFEDDSQIDVLTVERGPVTPGGEVIVVVQTWRQPSLLLEAEAGRE